MLHSEKNIKRLPGYVWVIWEVAATAYTSQTQSQLLLSEDAVSHQSYG